MKQRKILAAIDGSDYSHRVLERAIEYASAFSAQIVLLYCHRKFPKLLGQPYRDHIISEIMDETSNLVAPFVERLEQSGLDFMERFMEEPAGRMIPLVAEKEQCELIVLGSRGRSDLESLIVGSVTHKVLHMAKCSVLVVK